MPTTSVDRSDRLLDTLATRLHLDVRGGHPVPTAVRALTATAVAVAGSLAADALLVLAGQAAFPGTRGYPHFQFGDYATLTVIGVLGACLAWPLACWLSEQPRWLVSRTAVLATLVLWLPDLAIWVKGQPGRAVAVLVLMHLAIAIVTYAALVTIGRPTRPTSAWGVSRADR